jgi:DNA-binding CsgD family transcriptional regulator
MDIMARQGDLSGTRTEFLRADAAGLTTGPVRWSLPLLWSAAAIEARRSADPDGASAEVLMAVRRAAARLEVVFPVSHAIELLLEAELQRAEGDDDPDRWSAAVAAIETLQRPYELAAALLGKGRALLAAREHRAGLDCLARAHRLATALGAGLVLSDIETLTLQADGVTPPRDTPPSGERPASFGLTPRESEVLRLVSRGYSNRRISEELYISPKTTSTHVSNILAKLGASSRTEAAAIAHQSGL